MECYSLTVPSYYFRSFAWAFTLDFYISTVFFSIWLSHFVMIGDLRACYRLTFFYGANFVPYPTSSL